MPTSTGQIGVLPNHAPIITALDIGILTVRKRSRWTSFAVIGGFALVQENEITILVNAAVSRSCVEAKEAEIDLEDATRRLNQVTCEKAKVDATFAFKRAFARYQVTKTKRSFPLFSAFENYVFLNQNMAKYLGPRLRVVRRLGELPAFTKKTSKRTTRPGQHGASRKKTTQFGYRLIEKQKLRFYYGVSEKQLILYVKRARRAEGSTGRILIQQLEIRLDNIIYRLGLAPTLPFARQLVNHGHFWVDNKRVTIPRFSCLPQQKITVNSIIGREVNKNLQNCTQKLPSHLSIHKEEPTAFVHKWAERHEIPINLNELLVIEYYSNRI